MPWLSVRIGPSLGSFRTEMAAGPVGEASGVPSPVAADGVAVLDTAGVDTGELTLGVAVGEAALTLVVAAALDVAAPAALVVEVAFEEPPPHAASAVVMSAMSATAVAHRRPLPNPFTVVLLRCDTGNKEPSALRSGLSEGKVNYR